MRIVLHQPNSFQYRLTNICRKHCLPSNPLSVLHAAIHLHLHYYILLCIYCLSTQTCAITNRSRSSCLASCIYFKQFRPHNLDITPYNCSAKFQSSPVFIIQTHSCQQRSTDNSALRLLEYSFSDKQSLLIPAFLRLYWIPLPAVLFPNSAYLEDVSSGSPSQT